ncbi:uncharacterized protein MONBRDRAFT_30172 [Monosiga brevicollis MX1]|uniref:GST C-terminal domain-containing protein n=1 Tax=Monosiga brevicollis TaxID=81824 RepID=A9VD76_MONBE|nr:uncharacterized protein MONBRDRAFT_30172 [Monosiga brevicollis MX1]EDQ84507.1 predicted protein [Monosiga brevicollis MX1]|eukprot:XP_001750694.1 hypothetical protein [Monosiga brevicollis MX1]
MAKLYYHAGQRGEAEAIRMMFVEANLPVDDVAVTDADLAALDGEGKLLFGDLPVLEVDGMRLPKRHGAHFAVHIFFISEAAILEYIASKADAKSGGKDNRFLGSNENERSTARSLCSAANDLRRELMRLLKNRNSDAEKAFKKDTLPLYFGSFDKMAVASNDEDKGLGDGVHFTFGDLAVFEVVNAITHYMQVSIIRPYPNLKEWHDKAIRRPALEKHIHARPEATWSRIGKTKQAIDQAMMARIASTTFSISVVSLSLSLSLSLIEQCQAPLATQILL